MAAGVRLRSTPLVALPALVVLWLGACGGDDGGDSGGNGPGVGGNHGSIDGSLDSNAWPDTGSTGTGGLPAGDANPDGPADAAPDGPTEGSPDGGPSCTPAKELCSNGLDDDCDQDEDCADADCAFAECAADKRCKAQQCVSVFQTATVGCGSAANTGTKICEAAGWQGCVDSIGYWWWQCAGPGECPTPWTGLTCSSYATGADCVSVSLDSSQLHTAQKGCASVYGATDFGYDCTGYNPGYTVRVRCN